MMTGSALTLKGEVNGMGFDILVCFLASCHDSGFKSGLESSKMTAFRECKGEEIFQWDIS